MTPDQIITALEKHGEMQNVSQMTKNQYRGTRKGKTLTVRIIKNRSNWQLTVSDGSRSFPSNLLPWQATIFSDFHWREFD